MPSRSCPLCGGVGSVACGPSLDPSLTPAPLSPPGFPAAAYGPVAAAAVAAARGSGRKVYGTGGSQACPGVQGRGGPVGSVWLHLSPALTTARRVGTGGRGPGPATQGTSQPGSVMGLQTKGRLLFCP